MYSLFAALSDILHDFARGGGGGSGGGGGGGHSGGIGGSGGSGGGSPFVLAIILGFLGGSFGAGMIKSRLKSKLYAAIAMLGLVSLTGWGYGVIGGAVYGWTFVVVAIASSLIPVFSDPSALIGRMTRRSKQQLEMAASKDPVWVGQAIEARVRQVFADFQADWSSFNVEYMATYLTPRYLAHMTLVMQAIKQRGRRNSVEQAKIVNLYPTVVNDNVDNTQDSFTYFFVAKRMMSCWILLLAPSISYSLMIATLASAGALCAKGIIG